MCPLAVALAASRVATDMGINAEESEDVRVASLRSSLLLILPNILADTAGAVMRVQAGLPVPFQSANEWCAVTTDQTRVLK